MKKNVLNSLLDCALQFVLACLAALLVLTFLKPSSPPTLVAVDLDGYVDRLQKDWQAGNIDEDQLKQTLRNVRQAIAAIPAICPNTVVIDGKAVLAGDAVIDVDADDLESLNELSPKERRLYLQSILGCK